MGVSGQWTVQDGLGIVLGRSFFRLAVWVRFFIPLRPLLGSFWVAVGLFLGHLGLSWVRFGSSWARFGALRMACWGLIVLYSHQLIDLSSFQPAARQHLTSRAGGMRVARLYCQILTRNLKTIQTRSDPSGGGGFNRAARSPQGPGTKSTMDES